MFSNEKLERCLKSSFSLFLFSALFALALWDPRRDFDRYQGSQSRTEQKTINSYLKRIYWFTGGPIERVAWLRGFFKDLSFKKNCWLRLRVSQTKKFDSKLHLHFIIEIDVWITLHFDNSSDLCWIYVENDTTSLRQATSSTSFLEFVNFESSPKANVWKVQVELLWVYQLIY